MKLRTVLIAATIVLALTACGGSDGDATSTAAPTTAPADAADTAPATADDAIAGAEDFADDLVDSLETAQAAAGGGSVTLTVGDETWTFDSVLCAFGPEEIGQEGAEFVLSSIQDGNQMYVSIDSFGHSVSLNDIDDFVNPSVSLTSAFGADDFIILDGKSFSGSADFMDDTSDSFDTTPGSFSGTCP